jgi:hypothetical protein
VVIDAMDEYQTSTSTRWTRCSSRSQMSYAKQQAYSIGCKISGRGTAAWWTQEYAVIRSETQACMRCHALKIGIRLGTLCDAASRRTKR